MSPVTMARSLCFRRMTQPISGSWETSPYRKKSTAWPLIPATTESTRLSRKRMELLRPKLQYSRSYPLDDVRYGDPGRSASAGVSGEVYALLSEAGLYWLRRPDCARRLYAEGSCR